MAAKTKQGVKLSPQLQAMLSELLKGALDPKSGTSVETKAVVEPSRPKKKGLLGFFDNALSVVKKAVPSVTGVLSNMPGVVGIAGKLLSTLNDDEWFDEFTGNGASFNTMMLGLQYNNQASSARFTKYDARSAFGNFFTYTPDFTSDAINGNIMPSVLAFIRTKTNNVLSDDIGGYAEVMTQNVYLVALNYTLLKYLRLAEKQPLNIPNVTALFPCISPINLNTIKSLQLSLQQYIDSTVKIPHALCEYLRWRFGTFFRSSNSGRPGYIAYDLDPFRDAHREIIDDVGSGWFDEHVLDAVQATITKAQATITAQGRCAADIYLAYSNHVMPKDVEPIHYDEKEYCLRTNLTLPNQRQFRNNPVLVMDSALNMNAAIQAIAISTGSTYKSVVADGFINKNGGQYLMFPVAALAISTYFTSNPSVGTISLNVGWDTVIASEDTDSYANRPTAPNKGQLTSITYTGAFASYAEEPTTAKWANNIALSGMMSLQIHNKGVFVDVGTIDSTMPSTLVSFGITALTYDTADVSVEALASVQLSAFRNLMRGDYYAKINRTAEISSEVKNLVDTAIDNDIVSVKATPVATAAVSSKTAI